VSKRIQKNEHHLSASVDDVDTPANSRTDKNIHETVNENSQDSSEDC